MKRLAIILASLLALAPCASGYIIFFEGIADNTPIGDQFAAQGVLFSSPGPLGMPVVYGVFPSPVTPQNCLVGEYEHPDTNPGPEYGNNATALPITITFVDPLNPERPAWTTTVSLYVVWTNVGNVTRADAYDIEDALVDTVEITGLAGVLSNPLHLASAQGIHRVVVTFNAEGSQGDFEDNSGIDNLDFGPLEVPAPAYRETWGAVKALYR